MAEQITVVMDVIAKMDKAEGEFKKLQGTLQKLKLPNNLDSGFKKSFSNIESLFAKYKAQLEEGFDSKASVNSFMKTSKAIDIELDRLSKHFTELTGKEITFKVKSEELKQAEQALKDLATAKEKFGQDTLKLKVDGIRKDEFSSVKSALQELQRITKGNTGKAAGNILEGLEVGNIQQIKKGMDDLAKSFKNVKSEAKLIDIKKAFGLDITDVVNKIIKTLQGAEGEMDAFSQKSKTATENINQIKSDQIAKAADEVSKAVSDYEQLEGQVRQTTAATQEYARSTQEISRQLGELQQSTQYFFSLRNMINLFKRGIDDAIQSVKELDKAMTDTAVVTDYKVSDMWNMLPQYTQIANELGATTQGAYETMTLYFQQGLDQQAAFEIGAETMKMARIAGLDYAETTDMMTAALRGFNMELNEVSAKRINDVYSELAAITASDTEELGTAMQRTASIAHSAGMSFEGTTAFLAQAIETTREPAENIGTAMKTIVARFQEMKKNPLEIAEVDGEEVSYNKVDQALQSIGVSLKDTNGQFRELDQVFLDISQRWDSLSQTQQRYIATVAAGSRQQSRFIAMMDNYDRTMQLVEAANNSAGASDEQFGKTMDSLEAKLNKLHNAWQQFTMGIANNGMIKLFVDGMTGALNIVNKLIDTFSGGIGPLKSFMSIFAAFTGLKAAGRFANAMIGGLGGLIDPQKSFTEGLAQGITGNRQAVNAAQAHAISDPIVRAIYDTSNREIQTQNQQSQIAGAYTERDAFRGARQELLGYTKKDNVYNLKQLQDTLSGLSAKNQNILMRGAAGTSFNMKQSALSYYYKQLGDDKAAKQAIKQAERSLNNARAKGEITWSEYFKAISDPSIMAKAIDKTRNGAGAQAAEKILNSLNKSIIDKGDNAFTTTAEKIKQDIIEAYSEQGYDQSAIDNYLANEQTQAYIKAEAEKSRQTAISGEIEKITAKNGGWANLLNQTGRFGTKVSEAGMSIQAFASILTSSANPALQTFGAVLSTVGGLFSGLGMGISGLSSTFTAVAESGAMTAVFGGAAAAATGWLFALAGAIAAIVALVKRSRAKTREEAEKVTTDFKDKSEKNQTNLVNLKEWQAELAVLSKGVDKNGLNISLDSSDYQRYLEITQGIADINPDIVQGYNSQGHAIIDNNKALQKTLDLERQHGKELIKNYTNTESWNKLLKARNLERYSMMSATDDTKVDENGNYGTIGKELKPRNQMRMEARSIARLLQGSSQYIDLSDIIDLKALSNGSIAEFNNFRQNFDIIRHRIGLAIEEAGEDWSERSRNALLEGLSGFSTASDELDELVQPIYEMMSTYATDSIDFERMADPLKTGFQQVLKSIAENGNYEDDAAMRNAVDQQLKTFSNFSKEYQKIEKDIEKAQRDFADSQDEAAYQAAVHIDDGPIEQLKALKAEFENTPGGEALAEWVDNQIDRIEKRTFDGTASIAEAWDTLSDEVAAAEGAFEAFEDSIKSDYATAANSMKQIYETATAETNGIQLHLEGLGDKTAWKAGEELFGDISGWGIKDLRKAFADFEPMLQDGQAGVEGFVSRVLDANSELEELVANSNGALELENGFFSKIDDTLDPEIWSKVAETLGMSEQFLISMVQKAKQFFGIDTSNYDQIRTALGNNTNAIKGTKTTTYTDNEGVEHKNAAVYYMTDDDLRELMGAEYNSGAETKKQELSEKGIEVLPDIAKTSAEDLGKILKDGFEFNQKDQAAGIASLVDTFGQKYDSDSILKMAQAYFDKGEGDDAFNQQVLDAYDHFWDNQEYPTLGPVQNIESLVAQIASSFNRDTVQNGGLTDDLRQSDNFKEAIFGKTGVDDSIANFFRKGLDENGNALTKESYGQNLAELNKIQAAGEIYLNDLKTGMQKAASEGNEAQAQYYSNEMQKTQTYLDALGKAVDAGIEKFKEGTEEPPTTSETPSTTSTPSNPYDQAEEELYSRNTKRIEQLWHDFWHAADESKPDVSTNDTNDGGLSTKDGGEGFQQNTQADSSIVQAATDLTEAGNSLNEGSTTLFAGLQEAATSLNTAAQNLTNAANILGNNNNNNNVKSNGLPDGVAGPPAPATVENNVNGTATIDTSAAIASLTELANKATETQGIINQGATFTITTPGAGKLTKAAESAKTLSSNTGTKTIGVSTGSVDTSSVKKAQSTIKNIQAKIQVGANVDSAIAAARRAQRTINGLSTKINISPNFTGSWRKNLDVYEVKHKAAKGQNNHGIIAPPSFGSAARGKYGQVGPKGKGGLTLTGELGYEVAWLPDENRSLILGANGPQLIDLPSNAVVWSHEQSEKILKQKAIPAGSHAGPDTATFDDVLGIVNKVKGGKASKKASKKATKKTTKKTSKKSKNKSEKEAEKLFEKANVWWDNFARRTEAYQRNIDKASKAFEKSLKGLTGTAKNAKTALTTYQNSLIKSAQENNVGLQQAKNQLYNLDNGIGDDALALISYSATTTSTKKNKKGKKKTTTSTTSKQEFVNLGGYIDYNAALDTYEINQAALDTIANLEQRKAIADAANQKLNDLLSKRNNAEDAIQKAREELDKVADTMYETFYAWEKSITEIYLLSKRLEVLSSFKNFRSDLVDFETAMLKAGVQISEAGKNNILQYLTDQQQDLTNQINVANQLITAREKDYQDALNADTYFEKLQKSIKDGNVSEDAIEDYQAAEKALEIFKEVGGDMAAAIQKANEFNDEEYSKGFNDKVQKVLDDIAQKENDVINASSEAVKLSAEALSMIEDYNDYIIDFQNDMLEGVKQQAEEQIDRLDKLNDSLTKALKNLLDEVKRKLDERRRVEDNAKTESDIARKQQRLAMLRADTSGGHQVEIAQLEQEIADSQQNYQRTLEDQLLDKLQEQADKAEQQRQQQIDLLQAANEVAISNGTTMKQIEEWLAKGDEASKNALKEAYRTKQGYYDEDTSQKERERIDNSFEEAYAKYGAYIEALPEWDRIARNADLTTNVSAHAQSTVNKLSSAEVNEKSEEADKAIEEARAQKEKALAAEQTSTPTTTAPAGPSAAEIYQNQLAGVKKIAPKNVSKDNINALYSYGAAAGVGKAQVLKDLVGAGGADPFTWANIIKPILDSSGVNRWNLVKTFGESSSATKAVLDYFNTTLKKLKKQDGWKNATAFATGGLANYTGPAWLDGTPSKPELILNAKDTQNFIALRDVLSNAMKSTGSTSNNYGDIMYEININVDHLNNDYDVDKVVERVKKDIVKGAGYRNVTQVRNFR